MKWALVIDLMASAALNKIPDSPTFARISEVRQAFCVSEYSLVVESGV